MKQQGPVVMLNLLISCNLDTLTGWKISSRLVNWIFGASFIYFVAKQASMLQMSLSNSHNLFAAALTSGFLLLLCILVLLFLLPSSVTFVFCVDDELGSKKTDMLHSSEEGPTLVSEDKSLLVNPSLESDDGKRVEDSVQVSNGSEVEGSSIENLLPEQGLLPHTSSFPSSNPLKRKFDSSNKVAFVSVKRPTVSAATTPFFPVEEIKSDNENKEDPFFSLLTGGNIKDSIF